VANQDVSDEIQRLLSRLTEWQRMSGMPPEGRPHFTSLGESNAAIEDLKHKLDSLGVSYRWSESAEEYQLDSSKPPKPVD
jgi:hypothetical protein